MVQKYLIPDISTWMCNLLLSTEDTATMILFLKKVQTNIYIGSEYISVRNSCSWLLFTSNITIFIEGFSCWYRLQYISMWTSRDICLSLIYDIWIPTFNIFSTIAQKFILLEKLTYIFLSISEHIYNHDEQWQWQWQWKSFYCHEDT